MSEKDGDDDGQKPKNVFSTLMADGEWLFIKGEYKKAIDSFTTALTLKPDEKNCFVGRAKCYLKMGQSENALKDAEASLKEDKTFFERVQPITAIQHLTKERKQQTQKTPKNEKTTRQLLGEFYSDKKYLENLLKDEDLVKGKTRSGERLQDVIQSCLTYLDTCTELWNPEKPICARERDRKLMQQKCSKLHSSALSEPAQFLLKSLDDIDAELTSGNAEGGLKKAKGVMKTVQGWSEKEIPNKKEVLGSLHSCIGNALIDLGNMDKALDHHQKDLELAKQCKLPEAMSRALDNIGRVYARTGQFTKAIEFWEKKIPLVRGGLEKTWLFHEIGWCYLELNRYKEARDYGVRSVAAADEIADGKWQINANVLVAQSEMKLGNFESSVTSFDRALTHAKLQGDDFATNAIQKALDEAKQHLSQ